MSNNINFIGPVSPFCDDINCCSIDDAIKYLDSKYLIAIDTETEGLDWNKDKVIMLQLGDNDKQFIIDTRFTNIEPLRNILEDSNRIFIGQNIKFDYKFLLASFNIRLRSVYDTMLAECILNCGKRNVGYSLANICKRYVGYEMSKNIRNQFSKMSGQNYSLQQIEYGALDVKFLHEIREKQLNKIKSFNLEKLIELENRATLAFAEIEYNGMKFNCNKWLKVAENVGTEHIEKEKELD